MNWWLRAVMDAYWSAADQWEARREQETNLFAAEMAAFAVDHPRPQLRDFLTASRLH